MTKRVISTCFATGSDSRKSTSVVKAGKTITIGVVVGPIQNIAEDVQAVAENITAQLTALAKQVQESPDVKAVRFSLITSGGAHCELGGQFTLNGRNLAGDKSIRRLTKHIINNVPTGSQETRVCDSLSKLDDLGNGAKPDLTIVYGSGFKVADGQDRQAEVPDTAENTEQAALEHGAVIIPIDPAAKVTNVTSLQFAHLFQASQGITRDHLQNPNSAALSHALATKSILLPLRAEDNLQLNAKHEPAGCLPFAGGVGGGGGRLPAWPLLLLLLAPTQCEGSPFKFPGWGGSGSGSEITDDQKAPATPETVTKPPADHVPE